MTDDIIELERLLRDILSPSGIDIASATAVNRINDIDHLLAHYMGGRDIFLTDDNGILKKAKNIKDVSGIIVMSPSDFVASLS